MAVVLLRGRNVWVEIAVLRNSRREALVVRTRFLARNIFGRRRRKVLCGLFSPDATKKNESPFF